MKIKSQLFWLMISLPLVLVGPILAAEPRRDEGLSVHMLPDRVAKLQSSHGGFTVSDPLTKKMGSTYAEPEELLKYFYRLPESTQQNGIWIVTTNPDSYSEYELLKIEKLSAISSDKNVPVFTCRAIELPHGWKRLNTNLQSNQMTSSS